MRKIFLFVVIIASAFCVFWYSSNDVSNAEFLAHQWIITSQSTTKWYRLDATITRAEVVGMALKIKWTNLLDNYACKNYFIDVKYDHTNNWICRAMEIAADQGIISRSNLKARPNDTITRAEALAIFIKAIWLSEKVNENEWVGLDFDTKTEWQLQLLRWVFGSGLFHIWDFKNQIVYTNSSYISTNTRSSFYPNHVATRADVFSFAKIVWEEIWIYIWEWWCDNCGGLWDAFLAIDVKEKKEVNEKKIYYFGNKFQYNAEWTMEWRYPFFITVQDANSFRSDVFSNSDFFSGIWKWNNRTYYKFLSSGICSTEYAIFPSAKHLIKAESECFGDYKDISQWLKEIEFDPSYVELKPRAQDVLFAYYEQLRNFFTLSAFKMRDPAWVSLETFQSWYRNVTSVIFREDTLKDLGNSTYEFLVDMTENGVKSTYKVRSKVDLENFKINNISSVKQ